MKKQKQKKAQPPPSHPPTPQKKTKKRKNKKKSNRKCGISFIMHTQGNFNEILTHTDLFCDRRDFKYIVVLLIFLEFLKKGEIL